MADTRKLVTIDSAGTVTTVKDLEVSSTYMAVRDSFNVKAPDRQTAYSGAPRRYAGASAVSETHGNAEVQWQVLVRGATQDACLQNVEAMLAAIEPLSYPGLHLEWRPDGATASTYYEVRGPAKWQSDYKWTRFQGALSLIVDIAIPVAPLAKGGLVTQVISSFTTPNLVQVPSAIGGAAPAKVDVTVSKAGSQAGPAFAMLAWWSRLPTPPGGYSNVFSILEAESGGSLATWASGADAAARGGSRLVATASGAGTTSAKYAIHTGGIVAGTVDVEIWARVYLASTLVSPRIIASAATDNMGGASSYTREWGSVGRPLNVPSASGYRLTRVGTITLPITGVDPRWALTVGMSWAAGSSGTVGLDWLLLVPARQRAVSPGSELLDSSYPRFMPTSTAAISKLITSDLAGALVSGGVNAADPGLGGTAIEMPTGNVDMAVLLSEMPADEPVSANTIGAGYTGTTMSLAITPRYFLARA